MHESTEGAYGSLASSGTAAPGNGLPPLKTVELDASHDVAGFVCSRSERVQNFLREHARRFVDKRYASVFVWIDPELPTRILGYYTLSPSSVAKRDLINKHDRKQFVEQGIPVPIALIGYLGKCDGAFQGLGAALVVDAAIRIAQGEPLRAWGIGLDPENEQLANWYATLGFVATKVGPVEGTGPAIERPRFMYGHLRDFLPRLG
jgi:hypothetical protein